VHISSSESDMQINKESKKETFFFLICRHMQQEHKDFRLKRLAYAAAVDIAAFKKW